MIDKELRNKIIKEVSEGASYRATAKKYGLSVEGVRDICLKAGVRSRFKSITTKMSDDEIINEIRKHKVISIRDLGRVLGYSDLTNRAFRMARDGKIYILNIGDRRYVFATKDDLKEWCTDRIKKMPRKLRLIFIEKLRHLGIDIKMKKSYALIPIDRKLHKKIKKKASKEGLTIKEFVDKLLKEGM